MRELRRERQAAVSTCLLPAPLPKNRFGQSGVQEGAGTMGVLCFLEALKDPDRQPKDEQAGFCSWKVGHPFSGAFRHVRCGHLASWGCGGALEALQRNLHTLDPRRDHETSVPL